MPRTRRARSTTCGKSTTDYVLVAIAYAEQAIADTKRQTHGLWIRLAAKRFLRDLKRAQRKRPPFVFSAQRANHVCRFVERLPHVEGDWPSATIVLQPFQIFFLVQLFGFRTLNGDRRYTTALFCIARKNAKSTLAASILLYLLCCEREQGPQIFSAATTGNQARIVWRIARLMVDRLADLRRTFELEAYANAIARYANGGTFKPINARASSQDGLNPSSFCLDELHAHKSGDLKNVLTSAAGARSNPLFLYTTTEGYEQPSGPWAEERAYAQNILQEVIDADHYLAVIFSVDDEDEDFDSTKWIKSNPLMTVSPTLAEAIEKDAKEAAQKPGSFSEYRIKRLNRRAESARGWINLPKWRKCSGPVPLDELVGARCWGAFDLAATTDLTAWRLLWLVDGIYYTWGRVWIPREAVTQRTERGSMFYQAWADAGFVTIIDGDTIDYEIVERDIYADCQRFSPAQVAYDPWNAGYIATKLTEKQVPLVQFIQGARSYNPAMHACERAYLSGRLQHANDPVLTWCAANLVPRTDANMNLAPSKKRSPDKIDAMCALLMCFGLAELAEDEGDIAGFIANPIIA
jgi:phage terminase large subunit-like protein